MLFFRERLTLLRVGLCLLVITGVILVAQPTFIFQNGIITSGQNETSRELIQHDTKFYIGVIISLLCACSGYR